MAMMRMLGDGKETTVFIVNINSGWDERHDEWANRFKRMRNGYPKM